MSVLIRDYRVTWALCAIFSLFSMSHSKAESIRIIGYDISPLVKVSDGKKIAGPAFNYVQDMFKIAGVEYTAEGVPFSRAISLLEENNTIVVALERFSARESKYSWISDLIPDDGYVFVNKNSEPIIVSLDQARALKSIAALEGSSAFNLLNIRGYTQVDVASSYITIARKLLASRNDAWLGTKIIARHILREVPGASEALAVGPVIAPIPIWIVGSLSLSQEVVTKLQKAAETLKNNGRYAAFRAELE